MQLNENKPKNKVLLHSCCGICSAHPIKLLKELGYDPIAYFFNPNIYPATEHQKRLESQKKVCAEMDCELIVETYDHELYCEVVSGYEHEPERGKRCKRCFELRLLKTAQKARELDIKNFTTSITTSPHKDFKVISQIGKHFSGYFKINFLDIDFKKQDGFLKSNKIAKELGLYRQDYCGCNLSERLNLDGLIND